MSFPTGRSRRFRLGCGLAGPELLEVRALAAVTVNAGQVVRVVDPQLMGVNATYWDASLNTSQTAHRWCKPLDSICSGFGWVGFGQNALQCADLYGSGNGPQHGQFCCLDERSGRGDARLRLRAARRKPPQSLLNAPGGSDHADRRRRPKMERPGQSMANGQLAKRGLLGEPARPPLATDDGLNFVRPGTYRAFGFNYFQESATKSTVAGRSITTARSMTRPLM